ncbi:hypothetical protein CISG_04029 [Coccidioides immitis RMSCC 3703]|nr:hypothetical protein CIRG_08626 [Coccidioides immitis RMSCC 2394]KMU74100.1 hypothetical protein CISG_04029 [Coccidioides immitis RMSCC 3703]
MIEKVRNMSCVDCRFAPACVTVRTRNLCENCFIRFLQTKVLRRMERYRLRNAPKDRQRKLILPLSYGVSSLALLHIVSSLLLKQRTTGQKRTAFDLHVLIVDPVSLHPSKGAAASGRLAKIKEAYPDNTYSEVPLRSIFDYDPDIRGDISQHTGIPLGSNPSRSDEEILNLFRASFSTATARADIDGILLRRLIVAFAKSHKCDGILWGDSDSRLAAKTLANVAKGRGSSLVWNVCEGMSPWDIYFNFPLRDLYKSELEVYASYALRDLQQIIDQDPRNFEDLSNRHMSIEDLMSQYVLTQGAKYPGVMANIVRTVDKLTTPGVENAKMCILCRVPAGENLNAASGSQMDIGSNGETTTVPRSTCYGCMRTLLDMKAPTSNSG